MQTQETSGRIFDRTGSQMNIENIFISINSATSTRLVPAATGKSVIVISALIENAAGANTLTFDSNDETTSAAIFPQLILASGEQDVLPRNIDGWFETWNGEGLRIRNSGSVASNVRITYAYRDNATERPIGAIALSDDQYTKSGAVGTATITITRTQTAGPTSIHFFTTDGTAVAGVNYTSVDSTVTFADGIGSATVGVPVITGDVALDKTVTLTIDTPGAYSILGSPDTAELTIQHL